MSYLRRLMFFKFRLLIPFLFFVAIFFIGCTKSHEIVPIGEDRKWMEKFFHDLLFCEGGAYTLWGHKPVTEIVLYHFTEEEVEEMTRSVDELEDCIVQDVYDLPENWERWEAVKGKFPLHKYLLFKSQYPGDEKISFIYFVDILKAACIIEENYEVFRKNIGFEFHPVDVVLQMPDSNSEFWKRVRQSENSSLLWGILFGYGRTNSMAFNWKYKEGSSRVDEFFSKIRSKPSNLPLKGQVKFSSSNFEIPGFFSFQEDDREILRYRKEQKEIKKIYKKNDLLSITLRKLTAK